MPIHLDNEDLSSSQQMEVAVNGPDGATHLILCTGVADLGLGGNQTYTFFVGPRLARRQFVGAIASGAFSRIGACHIIPAANDVPVEQSANLISIIAMYDESGQVKVEAEVSNSAAMKLSISYCVSILAELPPTMF